MPRSLRSVLAGTLALVLGALLLAWGPTGTVPSVQAASPVLPTSAAHPYSDPTWFPLRLPARVGCARSGCGTTSDHGYDAIDLLGAQGDPVYAAGAGIAHVGGDSGACSSTGEAEGGRWVWIDHGGSVVSGYHHLDTITVRDGELVTPATQIGTMGHSGDVPPCTTAYLHFEVRHGGPTGDRVDFGSLRGCGANGPLRLPEALGFGSWNDPGLHPAKRLSTPALDSRCIGADWTTTAASPTFLVTRSPGAVALTVDLPTGADAWAADLQIWRPSLKAWRTVAMPLVAASTGRTTVVGAEENDRRYRVRAAVHKGGGWGIWSEFREAVGAPAAPPVRYLQWKRRGSSTKSYLHLGWSRPDELGGPVTRYDAARRCGTKASSLRGWKTSKVGSGSAYANLRGLKKAKVCEVRVRALNAAGAGAWSATEKVTR